MRQESHRVQWQQWDNRSAGSLQRTKRDLITSSAAIRMTDAARAKDVTGLLRKTMKLRSSSSSSSGHCVPTGEELHHDYELVLVGTLFHHPPVVYETVVQEGGRATTGSDPFHVMRSLKANDNPLQIRDGMLDHLQRLQKKEQADEGSTTNKRKTSIAPKLQWFFVPTANTTTNSPILSCIELDGYSTGMEDEDKEDSADAADADNDDDDDGTNLYDDCHPHADSNDNTNGTHHHSLMNNNVGNRNDDPFCCYPWRRKDRPVQQKEDVESSANDSALLEEQKRQRQRQRQRRRREQISQVLQSIIRTPPTHDSPLASGFLLHQSLHDPHVWRQVHCILTESYLWCVHRSKMYNEDKQDEDNGEDETGIQSQPSNSSKCLKIRLARALLMHNSNNNNSDGSLASSSSPSQPPPSIFSFQIVSEHGVAYVFRTRSLASQQRWVHNLSVRMEEALDHEAMQHAELLVVGETRARFQRREHALVQAILPNANETKHSSGRIQLSNGLASGHESPFPEQYRTVLDNPLGNDQIKTVLQWGMQVMEYRETCRHIQTRLQATASSRAVSRSSSSSSLMDGAPSISSPTAATSSVDPKTQQMIRAAWDVCQMLLAKASSLLSPTTISSSNNNNLSTKGIETQCRHIEYVLTGKRRRRLGGMEGTDTTNGHSAATTSIRPDKIPPPMDLFDNLLLELQQQTRHM